MIQIVAHRHGFIPVLDDAGQPLKLTSSRQCFVNFAEVVAKIAPSERHNIYYTMAHHVGAADAPIDRAVRTKTTFEYQTIFGIDLDGIDHDRPWTDYLGVVADVLGVPVGNFTVISTGNGLHFIVHLKNPIRQSRYFEETKPAYLMLKDKMDNALSAAGLAGYMDMNIWDAARVLRLPGTINRKKDKLTGEWLPDKNCDLMQESPAIIDFDIMVASGYKAISSENLSPQEVRRNYPRPDFQEIYTNCNFIQWAVHNPEEVHEPDFFDLTSILAAMRPQDRVVLDDTERNAKDLTRYVFDKATASKALAGSNFDKKWEQGAKYGVRKCETIQSRWGQCNDCPHYAKIPSPIVLRGKKHIGSIDNGFWVMDNKGQYKYPNYNDLSLYFQEANNFLVTPGEVMWKFNGKKYDIVLPIQLKSWVEKTVNPTYPLREAHRVEFMHKIKAVGGVSPDEEEEIFDKGISGRLNFQNGVLDVRTGQLEEHSSRYGFKYMLPYDYIPNLTSEFFLDWLSTIMQDRVDLMELLLDNLAYCLWPDYDDHVFFIWIGGGSNGKSTMINVLHALLGKHNTSSISLDQLTGDRFACASLDGKLVNLAQESSGINLGFREINILQDLSSGDTVWVQHKGMRGYDMRNKAKLIFSANRPPRFADMGYSLTRRLIVIPFDHQITERDETIGIRLRTEEIPAIASMLVRRLQDNIKKHKGRFMLTRNSSTIEDAQSKLLASGNSVLTWANEALLSDTSVDDEAYVDPDEAYLSYTEWCKDSGLKNPSNKMQFINTIRTNFVTKAARKDIRVWIDAPKYGRKQKRMFIKTKWREQ